MSNKAVPVGGAVPGQQSTQNWNHLSHRCGHLILLSQKVAPKGEKKHLFGKIHTSAMGP